MNWDLGLQSPIHKNNGLFVSAIFFIFFLFVRKSSREIVEIKFLLKDGYDIYLKTDFCFSQLLSSTTLLWFRCSFPSVALTAFCPPSTSLTSSLQVFAMYYPNFCFASFLDYFSIHDFSPDIHPSSFIAPSTCRGSVFSCFQSVEPNRTFSILGKISNL